ncbi:hypothetical protein [Nocardia acidivorans]|uniref:hypothetical protein n=1 Tax=Nocardia acidivorans TaxID=404580 RepID=UPI000A4D9310|nr:hypothetical protein [Nocardia acidivorans]
MSAELSCLSHRNAAWGRANPKLAMQTHLDCHLDTCATKSAAWTALVASGKVVPDSCRPDWTES